MTTPGPCAACAEGRRRTSSASQADFPHLEISIEFLATYRAWSARGRDGRNPWLVLSTDVQRFRRTLDRADWQI